MKAMGYAKKVVTEISTYNDTGVSGLISGIQYKTSEGDTSNDNKVSLYDLKVERAVHDGSGNNINDTYAKKGALLNIIYPVGSIYISTNNNSPQNFLGGTWVRIEGKFLLGAGSGYNAGSTGGEATHTLSTSEMPEHSHNVYVYSSVSNGGYSRVAKAGPDYVTSASATVTASGTSYSVGNMSTGKNGSGQAHNNMPPYLAVYIWKRTA